jgi:hypothetical protein
MEPAWILQNGADLQAALFVIALVAFACLALALALAGPAWAAASAACSSAASFDRNALAQPQLQKWLWRIHRVHHLDTELTSARGRFHPRMLVGPLIDCRRWCFGLALGAAAYSCSTSR